MELLNVIIPPNDNFFIQLCSFRGLFITPIVVGAFADRPPGLLVQIVGVPFLHPPTVIVIFIFTQKYCPKLQNGAL